MWLVGDWRHRPRYIFKAMIIVFKVKRPLLDVANSWLLTEPNGRGQANLNEQTIPLNAFVDFQFDGRDLNGD